MKKRNIIAEHLEVDPEWVSVPAVDIDLAEHVKSHVVLSSSKLFYLGLSSWLLASKLVARKGQDT